MTESEPTAFETLARLCAEARGLRAPDPGAGIPNIPEPDRFTDLCRRHKVAVTAYRGLVSHGIDPSLPWMGELKRETFSSTLFRKTILLDLAELAEIFTRAKLRFAVLKGPATSILLYGDPLVREYTDLDILVDLDEASAVAPLIAGAGYSSLKNSDLVETPSLA